MKAFKHWLLALGVSVSAQAAIGPATPTPAPEITAAQIVAKNAEARGGVEAWHKISAMAWAGRVESSSQPNMPFVLEQKRPNKTRFDLSFAQQKTSRMFDGTEGWKLKTTVKSPRPELQPYTAEEMAFARNAAVIDGPLMDFSARGYAIAVEGLEDIQGRQAYRLRAEMPSGLVQRVWVDAQTFLVDFSRTGLEKRGNAWYSPGYDTAKRRVSIQVSAAFGEFNLLRR